MPIVPGMSLAAALCPRACEPAAAYMESDSAASVIRRHGAPEEQAEREQRPP